MNSLAASSIAAALIAIAPRIANACATCGLPIGGHDEHAFKMSVLFLIGGTYFTVAAIGGILYLTWRRSHRHALEAAKNIVNHGRALP